MKIKTVLAAILLSLIYPLVIMINLISTKMFDFNFFEITQNLFLISCVCLFISTILMSVLSALIVTER